MTQPEPAHYAFADLENLIYSARNRSCAVDFGELRRAVLARGATHTLAVTSDTPVMRDLESSLVQAGWHTEFCRAKYRTTGPAVKSNADSALALMIGYGCARDRPGTVSLLSGDGGLITDIGWFVARFLPGTNFQVWAFPHSLPSRWLPTDDSNVHAFHPLDESVVLMDDSGDKRRGGPGPRRWI